MATYKMIGADGRPYGPASAEQLRQWIAEGRANAQTQTLAEGAAEWKPLGALPEFGGHFAPRVPPTIAAHGRVRHTSGFATMGMIFGVVSLFFCCCYGFPLNILGIIFSCVGLGQINRYPETYEGHGLAIAGLAMSIASILIYAGLLIIAIATGHFHAHWNSYSF